MKFLPENKEEWLSFASFPFRAYVVIVSAFYLTWYLMMPCEPGEMFLLKPGESIPFALTMDITYGMIIIAAGFAGSFLALLVLAVILAVKKRYRDMAWNIVFAGLAFNSGFTAFAWTVPVK
jgi:hypothetical protein